MYIFFRFCFFLLCFSGFCWCCFCSFLQFFFCSYYLPQQHTHIQNEFIHKKNMCSTSQLDEFSNFLHVHIRIVCTENRECCGKRLLLEIYRTMNSNSYLSTKFDMNSSILFTLPNILKKFLV